MAYLEIERKFLVLDNFSKKGYEKQYLKQGYIFADEEKSVRVRISGEKGYITIKQKIDTFSFTRFEWEKEIALTDAKQLLSICKNGLIEKFRYRIPYENQLFEVDEFLGENSGLVLAEIELQSEDDKLIKPDWLGEEVTFDQRYHNSSLSVLPYTKWK